MKNCNKLVRDNVASLLKEQGYQEIKGKKLKGKEYRKELYSLFLQEYKETLTENQKNKLQVHYAEMLEVVRTLMVTTKSNIKQFKLDRDQQIIEWYKQLSPIKSKQKLVDARIDLLQRFYELLPMETEAIKDQLGDLLISFKQLVEANEFSFTQIEELRRDIYKRLGGFGQGVYLVNVSKTRSKVSTYSA